MGLVFHKEAKRVSELSSSHYLRLEVLLTICRRCLPRPPARRIVGKRFLHRAAKPGDAFLDKVETVVGKVEAHAIASKDATVHTKCIAGDKGDSLLHNRKLEQLTGVNTFR